MAADVSAEECLRLARTMTPRFDTAEPSEMLDGAFRRLQASACPALLVLQSDKVVGVLTQSALRANGKGEWRGQRGA